MKATNIIIQFLGAFFLAATAFPVQADSVEADCVMHKKGEKAKKGTGPCTISTRDGLIDIELKNGRTFNLKPTKKDNVYKDQEGKKVVRTEESTRSTKFKWDHAGVVVTWRD